MIWPSLIPQSPRSFIVNNTSRELSLSWKFPTLQMGRYFYVNTAIQKKKVAAKYVSR